MPEKQVFLLAAGGHGSVVLDALLRSGIPVAGIIDPGKALGSTIFDIHVVGGDDWLEQAAPSEVLLVNGAGVVPGRDFRYRLYNNWKQCGFDYLSVLHPSAIIGREVVLKEGAQIMAGAVLQCSVNIGVNAVVNTRASVDHDCIIHDHAFIGPGATLCGGVRIGEKAFLGAGAVVLPGISIGPGAIIGAGAVVARNVDGGKVVTGNPTSHQ